MLSKKSEIVVKNALLNSGSLALGLFDGVPDVHGEGVPEIAYSGYSRQPIEFDQVVDVGPVGNLNVIEIPRPPEGFAARSITHCAVFNDDQNSPFFEPGEMVLFGALRRNGIAAPYPLGHDSTFNIGINGVQFDLVNLAETANCGS